LKNWIGDASQPDVASECALFQHDETNLHMNRKHTPLRAGD